MLEKYLHTKQKQTSPRNSVHCLLQCGHQGAPKPMSDCPGQVEI